MRVLVATPTADGRVEAEMARSVASFMCEAVREKHSVAWAVYQSPFVAVARTTLVQEARRQEADGVLFWDSDVALPEAANPGAPLRLLAWPLATAVVRNRHVPTHYAIFEETEDNDITYVTTDTDLGSKPFPVGACGAALLWISSAVLADAEQHGFWPPFQVVQKPNGRIQGEDIYFSAGVRDLGHEIVCDPTIPTRHIGRASLDYQPPAATTKE